MRPWAVLVSNARAWVSTMGTSPGIHMPLPYASTDPRMLYVCCTVES
ncbi:hypothetical protein FRAAL5590 [Frankia alni ACN14a]|uniref:Uncharacterized protein n=1 Tax=Frankia alni (strain DSM 45986 / CECT 9034 / ACN14a) TaxID=326424 RepID=Q0RE88_FRAAA|nr:hypothetical protein FRAAL5590 [Frankia alni ACN14a]